MASAMGLTRKRLDATAHRFPVGARVRHPGTGRYRNGSPRPGWSGTVQPDTSGGHLGYVAGDAPAHAVVGIRDVVHVVPDPGLGLLPMWMVVDYLTPAPADRTRTRRGRS